MKEKPKRPNKVIFSKSTGQSLENTIIELQTAKKVIGAIPESFISDKFISDKYMVSKCECYGKDDAISQVEMNLYYDSSEVNDLNLNFPKGSSDVKITIGNAGNCGLRFVFDEVMYGIYFEKRDEKEVWNELTITEP
jgi:hypothetical protein